MPSESVGGWVVERDGETDLFILSDLARDGVVSKYVTQSPLVIGLALLLSVAGLVGLLVTLGVA